MKHRRLPPDHRPSWRDPNMPVLRNYTMPDGTIRTYVDPDYERRYREFLISMDTRDWRTDPTYHSRKDSK
jgi:hypothetical protein